MLKFLLNWVGWVASLSVLGLVSYQALRIVFRVRKSRAFLRSQETARERAHEAFREAQQNAPERLEYTPPMSPGHQVLEGDHEGHPYEVALFSHRDHDYTRISLPTLAPLSAQMFVIGVDNESLLDGLLRRDPFYLPEQMERFDHNFMLLGDQLWALASLNAADRAQIAALMEERHSLLHLRDDSLTYERRGLYEEPAPLLEVVSRLRELCHHMVHAEEARQRRSADLPETPKAAKAQGGASKAASVTQRMEPSFAADFLARFREDPEAHIRQRCLVVLLDQYGDTEEAQALREVMLDDPDPEVRFHAAKHLQEAGLEHIKELAAQEELPMELRIRAMKYLASQLSSERSLYVVRIFLLLLHADKLPDVAIKPVAGTIERFGHHLDETQALGLLAWESDNVDTHVIKLTAARLLKRSGTVRAVEPLHPYLQSRDRKLRKAAEQAIMHIQNRLGDVEAARLTIIEDDEDTAGSGNLSVLDELGALALIESLQQNEEDPLSDSSS